MLFTSVSFLLFAAVLLFLYYVIPKKGQWILLLCAGYGFYLCAGVEYLGFILFTTVTTYLAASKIGARLDVQDAYIAANKATLSRDERKAYKARVKSGNRTLMVLCLVFNFAMLAVCKACLVQPFAGLVAQTEGISFLSLGLPLGMSFYLFQSTGYVVDVYRGVARPEKNPFKFALFVSFFPQLVQGPISKFSQLAPTMYAPHDFDGKTVSFGLQRMLWGYFKKMVIADRIAVAIGALKGEEYTGVAFLVLSVFYAVQIYGDFTGGIDIAVGLSQALGITLPENFIRPFFSKNIAEYWRRWHISLGVWMKDYIFYPLSVCQPMLNLSKAARKKWSNFGKRLPVYIASVATWLVTGIWHGFNLHFIVWGLMNCFFIVLSEELEPLYERFHNRFHFKGKRWYSAFEILRMFMLMNLIRASDLFNDVGDYFRRLGSIFYTFNFDFLWNGSLMKLGLTAVDYAVLIGGIVLMFTVSVIQCSGSVREKIHQKPRVLRYGIWIVLFLIVLLMGSYGVGYDAGNFIYNQF